MHSPSFLPALAGSSWRSQLHQCSPAMQHQNAIYYLVVVHAVSSDAGELPEGRTYQRYSLVDIWTIRFVEDLPWMGVHIVVGNIILHHNDDVLLLHTSVLQDLVCLQEFTQ